MKEIFSRTEKLIGEEKLKKLHTKKVAIFGIGGVGSFVAEGLVRCGIENFILIDNDKISESNINRQIHATTKTIGEYKVDVMKNRMLEINPDVKIETYKSFFLPNNNEQIIDNTISYIVDAIDTVTAKIELVIQAEKLHIPIISSMGTGNKLNNTNFEIADIYSTDICPLAKVMRKELRKRNIQSLKVLYSKEKPKQLNETDKTPGSISFVPSVAGLIIAGEIVKDFLKE